MTPGTKIVEGETSLLNISGRPLPETTLCALRSAFSKGYNRLDVDALLAEVSAGDASLWRGTTPDGKYLCIVKIQQTLGVRYVNVVMIWGKSWIKHLDEGLALIERIGKHYGCKYISAMTERPGLARLYSKRSELAAQTWARRISDG